MSDVEKALGALLDALRWEADTSPNDDTADAVLAVQRAVESALASIQEEGADW